jgi:methylmalonyl-CoA mutase N-terminal domain/subunit
VNRFRIDEEDRELEVFEVDPKTLSRQLDRLKQIKAERDNVKVESALNALKNAAIEKTNLMSYLIDAVRAYTTVGEIVSTLKDIYGEAQHLSVF